MRGVVRPRGRLFRKYVVLFASLVSAALLTSGLVELYFSYRENLAALVALQREQAAGAAAKIEAFVRDIERQVGWASQGQVGARQTVEQRRFEFIRLQRQAPAITEVSQLDGAGREQLRVSRLAMDVVGSQTDFSADPRFKEARRGRPYFGPVYFRKESEPYMTSPAGGQRRRRDGGRGQPQVHLGRRLPDPDRLARAAPTSSTGAASWSPIPTSASSSRRPTCPVSSRSEAVAGAAGPGERREVTDRPGPRRAPGPDGIGADRAARLVGLRRAAARRGASRRSTRPPTGTSRSCSLGVALSVLASLLLARRMATPIQALQAGAARIGAGALDQRIDVKTGDELEGLADQFNRMAGQLQESYATLEQKVEDRTRELSEALEQQTATAEILRVISSSPTDIQPVLDIVAERAARLCEAVDGHVLRIEGELMRTVAHHGSIDAPSGEVMPRSLRPSRRDARHGGPAADRPGRARTP